MVFKRYKTEGNQLIIGDLPLFVQAQNLNGDHFSPEKALKSKKSLFQNPNFVTESHRAKINTLSCCSKFYVVDHAVYSLLVGWCIFKLRKAIMYSEVQRLMIDTQPTIIQCYRLRRHPCIMLFTSMSNVPNQLVNLHCF